MSWQEPKTNWAVGDGVSNNDMTRIEGNIVYLKDSPSMGSPTVITQSTDDNSTKVANTSFARSLDLGVDQTWQSPTRSAGTTYTNTTGKPIEIKVFSNVNNVNKQLNLYVNSSIVDAQSIAGAFIIKVGAIIPNGATYMVEASGDNIASWRELR